MPNDGPTLPLDLLCCPRCGGTLVPGAGLACSSCAVEFPTIGGLPWLFESPGAALGEWRARMHAFLAGLDAQAGRYRAAVTDQVTCASTRNRLKLLAAACADHARRLRAVLAPLVVEGGAAAPELYRALEVTLPVKQGLTGYYANLHRDWSWGAAENEAAYGFVDRALGADPPGRTLLLGVGAGRLAYDLHLRRRPAVLLGADLNPLLLLTAQQLFSGQAVELYEFPVAPRDIESHAILRRLAAPGPTAAGLHLIFADVTRGPFAPGAFDTVITPWLIDILDEDLAVLAARLNRWLRPGGRWVNSGSLAFQGDDPACRYSLEEVLSLVDAAGFGAVETHEEAMPYLCSPASRHGRREVVVTFSAVKQREIATPARVPRDPDWLEQPDLPVPLLPEMAGRQLELRVLAFVASLIDGRRSARDMARVLVDRRMMTEAEAEPAVRGFLRRFHEEARARSAATPSG